MSLDAMGSRTPLPTSLQVSIGGSSFPATATSSRELLLQADTLAEEVRQEQGHDSTYRLRERPDAS